MKEDNISQLGDYDAHSVYNNKRMGLVISLSSNLNYLISLIPQTGSNFRYLLSWRTIGFAKMSLTVSATRVRKFIYRWKKEQILSISFIMIIQGAVKLIQRVKIAHSF